MGDIVEFTTCENHRQIFYKITSNCINFDVKSNGPAVVGITKHPGTQCLRVVLGEADQSSIKTYDNDLIRITCGNVLNNVEYNRFWILWGRNFITLGERGTKDPLLKYKIKLPELKYVTFSVSDHGTPVHWRLELPPIFREPSLKTIFDGKLKWVEGDTQLPNDAVIGGFDNENLYIIRAKHRGSLTPGVFVPAEGCGFIPWGGQSHEKTTFEVLCGIDYKWIPTQDNKIPINAMEAGYSEVHHEPLYIGRAFYEGKVIPGKVQPSHRVCYITRGDYEKGVNNYEILVVPDKNIQNIENTMDVALGRRLPSNFDNDNAANYEDDYYDDNQYEDNHSDDPFD